LTERRGDELSDNDFLKSLFTEKKEEDSSYHEASKEVNDVNIERQPNSKATEGKAIEQKTFTPSNDKETPAMSETKKATKKNKVMASNPLLYMRLVEPIILGILIGLAKMYLPVNQAVLVALIILWIIFRNELKGVLKEILYATTLYMGIFLAQFYGQHWNGIRGLFFALLPELSMVIGNSIIWNIEANKGLEGKLNKYLPKKSFKAAISFAVFFFAGIIISSIAGYSSFGLALVTTLIWVGAIIIKIVVNSYRQWIGCVSLYSLGVMAGMIVFHWKGINFLRYSVFEFLLVYGNFFALFFIQLILFAMSALMIMPTNIKKQEVK
jgi:hypothetical protein